MAHEELKDSEKNTSKESKWGYMVPEYQPVPRVDPRIEEHADALKALGITFEPDGKWGLKINLPKNASIMYENSKSPGLQPLAPDFKLIYSKDTLKVISVESFTIWGKGSGGSQNTNIVSQNRDGTTDRINIVSKK